MNPLQKLKALGLHATVDGGRLIVGPVELLTDELREYIREMKPVILSLLAPKITARVILHPALPPGYPPPGTDIADWTPEQREVVRRCFHGPTGIHLLSRSKAGGNHA